jgi:hypothetical protein
VKAGAWVLVEAYDDDNHEVWLAKTLMHFGKKCQRKTTPRQKNRFPAKSTRFNDGDYAIAVEYYDRVQAVAPSPRGEQHFQWEDTAGDDDDDDMDDGPEIINSTELRSIVPVGDIIEVSPGVWRLSREAEEEALSWCR